METVIHQANPVEQTHTGSSLFHKLESLSVSNEAAETREGKSLAYFVWVYVAIFSFIMVAVMIAEKYFIQ